MFTCCGILYNHESPLRPTDFLPRKVARAAAAISLGLQEELVLGDLDARRDWGYAGDYARAMWLMLQHDEPGDYIVATGTSRSVADLVECAFDVVGLDWRDHVRSAPELQRGRAELHDLVGDPTKVKRVLGWEPTLTFEALVRLLVEADLERLRQAPAAAS
jgi:GDPmannose 4,6-dehydratase